MTAVTNADDVPPPTTQAPLVLGKGRLSIMVTNKLQNTSSEDIDVIHIPKKNNCNSSCLNLNSITILFMELSD